MTWREGFMKLGGEYARICSSDPEYFVSCLGKFKSMAYVAATIYNILESAKEIIPIEALGEAEKRKLYQTAKANSPDHSAKHLTIVCKAIYAFQIITN